MIEITAEIRAFIDKAAAGVELAEDEYIDPVSYTHLIGGLPPCLFLSFFTVPMTCTS